MALPKQINLVTFDVYGTLIDWEQGIVDAFATEAARDWNVDPRAQAHAAAFLSWVRRERGRSDRVAWRPGTTCDPSCRGDEEDPTYRSVGLDIFLTTPLHGQGLGREALRLAIAHYLERGHHRFTIDPAADNERAIRCYAAVGFKPVGVMRNYERVDDGPWHDGLLMDLLADELTA